MVCNVIFNNHNHDHDHTRQPQPLYSTHRQQGVFQQVVAGQETRDALRDIIEMLRNTRY